MVDVGSIIAYGQQLMHNSGATLVMPGLLLLASAGLLGYRSATESHFDLPLSGFMANILLQMIPLVALKWKIYSCSDRVSLVPLVLVKTTLMHIIMLSLRITSQVMQNNHLGQQQVAFDCVVLLAAIVLLRQVFDFPLSPSALWEQRDVRNLCILAIATATFTVCFFIFVEPSWFSWLGFGSRLYSREMSWYKIMFVASNYVDIVAFMPVVWRLYQVESELDDCNVGAVVSEETKSMVRYFLLFVIAFYAWDDVIDPIMSLLDEPLAMMAHAAHFMLLVDFCGFFLFQVGNPALNNNNTKGRQDEQMQGLLAEQGDLDD